MKLLKVFFIALFVCIAATSLVFIYLKKNNITYQRIPFYLTVEDQIGLNVDADAIYFGSTPPGGKSTRKLIFNNTDCRKCKVFLYAESSIQNWVVFSNNNFIITINKTVQVDVAASVPSNATVGNYNGTVIIEFRKII